MSNNSSSSKKSASPNGKVNISIDRSLITKVILVILSIVISFFAQKILYRPKFGTIIDSDMDSSGSVYILSVNEKSEKYKITKVNSSGYVDFEENLDRSSGGESLSYRNLDVDSKGNFFLVQEVKDTDTTVSDSSQYPIVKEKVEMYNQSGKKLKTVAFHDFKAEGLSSTSGYIRKLQTVNQKLSIICSNNNQFEIYSVNPYIDESPSKDISFSVSPPKIDDYNWVNDISVTLKGNVIYSTKSGDLYSLTSDGTLNDLKSLLPSSESSISSMSIDSLDNIFFTDLRTGNFYKFDTNSNMISLAYALENGINIDDLKIKDLRRIRVIKDSDFFASSKTFVNPYYVRFGSVNNMISNIKYNMFPYAFIYTIVGAIALILISLLLIQAFKMGVKRTYVSIKATCIFLPAFLLSMAMIVLIATKRSLGTYTDVLRQNQRIGAKIISENINGDSLQSMIYGNNYMSREFSSLKVSMNNSYNDIKDKVGDTSDYMVIYAIDNGKIYSITSSKYPGSYSYYNDLKFADPDMVDEKISIVDSLLERDEIQTIYSAWSDLKDSNKASVISLFRDVHGDLSACFTPIKDSNENIVGMVGNFLDEKSHVQKEFFSILKNISVFIGLASVLIFGYLCLVIWVILRPMRILNGGIEDLVNGHWKNRVPIVSKDEFASISIAFNNMSDKLETYTDNLMDLNTEYLRFVPKKLLTLMGKDKITDTNVGDGNVSEVAIVYVTFNINKVEESNNFEANLFLQLKQSYSRIFDIVDKNHGVVQNFASLGSTLLFENPIDALNSAIEILESSEQNVVYDNMRISIGYGPSFVGLIGNDVRRGVTMASKEMQRLIKIDKGMKNISINFSATEFIIDKIKDKFDPSFYRFVGKFKDVTDLTWVKLYEIISASDNLKKEYNIRTKSTFERAVQLHIDGNFEQSRKLFVDVLNINKDDATALNYINMCDIKLNNVSEKYGLHIGSILEN